MEAARNTCEGEEELHTEFWLQNLKGIDHLEDGVHKRRIH
jgi:hypothetical protein